MRKLLRIQRCSSLAVILCAASVWADTNTAPATMEERLQQLESKVDQLTKENTKLHKELGYDGKTALVVAKPAGKENKLAVGGYIQVQAEAGEAPDYRFNGVEDRIYVRRARVNVTGSFLEHFDYKLEGEFSGSLGESANARFQGTDLFVYWKQFDFASVRAGQFKTPFGYDQLLADTKTPLIERSLVNDALTESRQVGVSLNGTFFKNRLNYSAGAFNGSGVNNNWNDNDQFMSAGRLQGVPLKTKWGKQPVQWSLGVNGFYTEQDGANGPATLTKSGFGFDSVPGGAVDNIFIGHRTGFGVDSQLRIGPVDLTAEYLNAYFEPENSIPFSSFHSDGFYVIAACYIVPNKLQALVRYETFDPSTPVSGNRTDVWTFGLNYFIKGDDIRLVVNYMLGDRAASGSFPAEDGQGRFLARLQLVY